jgi:hypothetical protein
LRTGKLVDLVLIEAGVTPDAARHCAPQNRSRDFEKRDWKERTSKGRLMEASEPSRGHLLWLTGDSALMRIASETGWKSPIKKT